jgi:type IV pilus assembly protein PilO
MATKTAPMTPEAASRLEGALAQFRSLNMNEPGQWPRLPKVAAWAAATLAAVVAGWFLVLSAANDELEAEREREPKLKADYRGKLAQAVNLGELRKQKL